MKLIALTDVNKDNQEDKLNNVFKAVSDTLVLAKKSESKMPAKSDNEASFDDLLNAIDEG
jgi:hypothetical protein